MPLHPKTQSSLASFKSRLVLPPWYRLTQVVLEKRPLNGCSSSNSSSSGSSGSSVSSSSNNHSPKLHRFLGHKHRIDGRIAACVHDGLISRRYVHRRYHGNAGHVTPTTSSLGHIPGRSLIEVKTLVDSKSASRQPRPSKGRADGAATVAGGVARSLFNDRAFGALCSRPPRSIVAPPYSASASRGPSAKTSMATRRWPWRFFGPDPPIIVAVHKKTEKQAYG